MYVFLYYVTSFVSCTPTSDPNPNTILCPLNSPKLKAKQRIPKILFDMTCLYVYMLTVCIQSSRVFIHIQPNSYCLLEVVKSNAVQHKILWILYFTHFCSLSSLLILYAFSFLFRRINARVFYFLFIYQIRHLYYTYVACCYTIVFIPVFNFIQYITQEILFILTGNVN